jgi:hypothetical protein
VDELLTTKLASGATFAEAAEAAGVSKSTVQRRMADPSFRAGVGAERDDLIARVRGGMIARAECAALVLMELAQSGRSESVRLGAARSILELALDTRRRFDHLSLDEAQRMIGRILELAGERMPEDEFRLFVRDVSALAA